MKEKIYKLVLTLMVSLSLGAGPLAQNEIRKMLEAFSGIGDVHVEEQLSEAEEESEEIKVRNCIVSGESMDKSNKK